jgi:hypothetical protein
MYVYALAQRSSKFAAAADHKVMCLNICIPANMTLEYVMAMFKNFK